MVYETCSSGMMLGKTWWDVGEPGDGDAVDAKEERSDCDLLCRRRAYENADESCLAQATGECETSVGDDEVGEDVQSVPVGEDDSLRGLERSLRYEDCSSGIRKGLSAWPGVCPEEEGMGSGGRAFLGAW